jgi:hypothetical protein
MHLFFDVYMRIFTITISLTQWFLCIIENIKWKKAMKIILILVIDVQNNTDFMCGTLFALNHCLPMQLDDILLFYLYLPF